MPSPKDELQPDGLWLFDGVCNFCSGSVQTILKLDRKGAIHFTPIQSTYGRQLAIEAGLDPDEPSSFAFYVDGRALQKSEAILALMGRLPPPWRWGRIVGVLPRTLLDRAYDWLAANRYRLMGRKDACMVPPPDVRSRFLFDPPGA